MNVMVALLSTLILCPFKKKADNSFQISVKFSRQNSLVFLFFRHTELQQNNSVSNDVNTNNEFLKCRADAAAATLAIWIVKAFEK